MIEDYDVYHMNKKEFLLCLFKGFLLCLIISYLFYQNFFLCLFLSPYLYFFYKKEKRKKAENRKVKLNAEFLDGIHSLSVALEAGYSVENAFKVAIKDLGLMYSEDALIMIEFQCIVSQINHNIPIENAIADFAKRSKLEDVECFSEVFKTAKRTGGDLVAIIKMTSKTIGEKVEVMREIETLITAKKMEANIMKVVPFGILGYMLLGSPQFLKPLYHNLFGILFMTIILGIYLLLTKLVDKIIAIRV